MTSDDPFYKKKIIYVTWINIWNGSTEAAWWRASDYLGCKVQVQGIWQAINWNDKDHILTYCEAIRKAGIDVIALDFTNGMRWRWQAKLVQKFCLDHQMKFVIAFNPDAGKAMESGCREIWEIYAAPDAESSGAYLEKDGKPLAVLYTWRAGYTASMEQKGEFRQRFTTVWASGEDSEKDKWGWQIEPQVGPVLSRDAMYITGSVKFDSPSTTDAKWRTHIAWWDYGFVMAQRSKPKFLIVGSFDDVSERNLWMVADTRGGVPGRQIRDISGALSPEAYYRRVCDWVLKGKPSRIKGGVLPEGAYLARSSSGAVLTVAENRFAGAPALLAAFADRIEHYLWLYHLGNNVYRLIKLNAGLAFAVSETTVVLREDDESDGQRWLVQKHKGEYVFVNQANRQALSAKEAHVATVERDATAEAQRWTLTPRALLP